MIGLDGGQGVSLQEPLLLNHLSGETRVAGVTSSFDVDELFGRTTAWYPTPETLPTLLVRIDNRSSGSSCSGGALAVEEHRLARRSRYAYGPQYLAQESGLGCETDVGRVEAAGGVEPDRGRLGMPDALVAIDADRVAVPQDEELPERRLGSGRVDDHAVARLQFGRHGVALRLEDAHPRRVCVALVEQERFGKAPQGALCGAAYASAMVSAPALALTVISGIETRELRRGGWRRVRGWGARTGRVS